MKASRRTVRPAHPLPILFLVFVVGGIAAACGGDDRETGHARAPDRINVRGTATLDGAPFDADFLGAVVRRDGLVTPCQSGIPGVTQGRYTITVLADRAGRGCGRQGAEVVLWTFVGGSKIYSTAAFAWPTRGREARFDPQFSTVMPQGDSPRVTELSGEAFDRDGKRLPAGTPVDAYVGDVQCGVASVRQAESFTGYILSVVGPDSRRGCTQDAPITFQVNGRAATETYVNHLEGGGSGTGGTFRLTQS